MDILPSIVMSPWGTPHLVTRTSASRALDRPRLLEELLNLLAVLAVLDDSLEVRVAANVLFVDKDVWHGALARDSAERVLEVVAVALLVQLVRDILGVEAVEEALGVSAVGAVALAEDDCERGYVLAAVCVDARMTGRGYDV